LVAFVHVSLAAWWIGALWLLRHACRTLPDHLVTLLRRFSSQAFLAVGAMIFVGFALIVALVTWEELPSLTDYQRNLALKLLLVVAVIGVAIFNKVVLTTRIVGGDATAIATLRKSINVELALIGAVLIATAVMTTYTSPHD
jgi:putative copper export protein